MQVPIFEPVEFFRYWENRAEFPNVTFVHRAFLSYKVIIKGVLRFTWQKKKEEFRLQSAFAE